MIIAGNIAGWLMTRAGMYALGALGFAGLVVWFALSNQAKGVQKERARVEKIGKKTDAKATAARRAAERDADRVLERFFRD